jgi:SAM-dependent methyltransferase
LDTQLSATYSGNYPIENRVGEIERLHVQSEAMAPDTVAMLDRFGPMRGWTCLDIGCGPGGITDLLSVRVGPAGRVIGLDMNAEFLESARKGAPENVEFQLGDAYGSDLPAGTFDLVHMRFVASTAGSPERLLKEATRLVRRGGIVALQEPDGSTLKPMVDYLPSTVESLRGVILKLGLLSENALAVALADCRRHLATPGTAFTMYTVAQVWGRTA